MVFLYSDSKKINWFIICGADQFNWDSTKSKWKLHNVVERRLDSISERINQVDRKCLLAYNFKPRDLRKDDYLKDQIPTPELDEFIKTGKITGFRNVEYTVG